MALADVRVGDELLVRVEAIDIVGDASAAADEPDPDALLAVVQGRGAADLERNARRTELLAQQRADFEEIRRLALDAARGGDSIAARAAWRSAEALAVVWPQILASA